MASLGICADHLEINVKVLQNLVGQSVIDRQVRGKYEVDRIRLQYLQHICRKAAGNGNLEDEITARLWLHRVVAQRLHADEEKCTSELRAYFVVKLRYTFRCNFYCSTTLNL